ncbi:MAG TPA: glycoside hydrolase family 88 protein [Sunxiuqinia sp.]|nr:glycoside hydrolase family 88 protein [Sunxiuqinia sp.]
MNQFKTKKIYFLPVLLGLIFSQCTSATKNTTEKKSAGEGLMMAVKMANSEMKHFPNPGTVDFNPKGKWNYTGGLVAYSMIQVWEKTGDKKYYDYAKSYADQFIDSTGQIKGYKMAAYKLDAVNSGRFLFDLYSKTNDERYKKAIKILSDQFNTQPRTTEGGFWHKKIYTEQMWLDGLYMGAPFLARYGVEFNDTTALNEVIDQFEVIHKHTYNPEVGLNYHGWDESKKQRWADPKTGCSPNFWGRAEGWYAMALVDVLDYLPKNYPSREKLVAIFKQVAAGIKKFQDPKSGLWYQVLDQGDRKGNYLEASASSMFVYALEKGVRLNYIDQSYQKVAAKGYQGILSHFIKKNDNGTISLTTVCAVAGLGGHPYRDGSFEYYIGEPTRDNDPKGVGPFILASLEMNK